VIWAVVSLRGYRKEYNIFLFAIFCLFIASIYRVITASYKGEEMLAYLGTFERLYEVLSGGLVAVISMAYGINKFSPIVGRALSVFGLFGFLLLVPNGLFDFGAMSTVQICGISCFLTAVLLLGMEMTPERNIVISFLTLTPLTFVGNLTYSIYLVHFPIVIIGDEIGFPKGEPWRTLALVSSSVLLAWITNRYIEEPGKKFTSDRKVLWIGLGLLCSVLVAIFCWQLLLGNEFIQGMYYNAHPNEKPSNIILSSDPLAETPKPNENTEIISKSPPLIIQTKPSVNIPVLKPNTTPTLVPTPIPLIQQITPKTPLKPKGARIVIAGDSMAPKWGISFSVLRSQGYNFSLTMSESGGCVLYWTSGNDKDPSVRSRSLEPETFFVFLTG
jgi:hypothetical protein